MMEFLCSYLEHVTILGLFFALLLAGLGIPIPEDLILITAGVLAYQGVIHLGWAIPILYIGVLSGDLLNGSHKGLAQAAREPSSTRMPARVNSACCSGAPAQVAISRASTAGTAETSA